MSYVSTKILISYHLLDHLHDIPTNGHHVGQGVSLKSEANGGHLYSYELPSQLEGSLVVRSRGISLGRERKREKRWKGIVEW